jgi:hypothetical protein
MNSLPCCRRISDLGVHLFGHTEDDESESDRARLGFRVVQHAFSMPSLSTYARP